MTRQKLTKTVVEALPVPEAGYTIHRDAELRGFGVRVTANGVRAYFVERKQYGKTIRSTLGQHGEISATEARREAEQVLASIRAGDNPNTIKRAKIAAARAEVITFGVIAEDYIRERTEVGLKPRTISDYRKDMAGPLADLVGVPAQTVTREAVATLQKELTAKRGPTTANRAMRFVRAVCNYAVENERYQTPEGEPLMTSNPVAVLKTRRLWNPSSRRHTYLSAATLGVWVDAVMSIDPLRWAERHEAAPARARSVITYLFVMCCLGFRSVEAAHIRVEDWSSQDGILIIPDHKSSRLRSEPFWLPVGWRVRAMLDALPRRKPRHGFLIHNEADDGPIITPRAIIDDISERSGARATPHDLRRTFASVLNALSPSPSHYQIKRLMNHSRRSSDDVTEDYIQHDPETLRAILQRVEDEVFGSSSYCRPTLPA